MLGWNNIAMLEKLAQSSEQWKILRTTLMLSRLQWKVSQAQWSDLRGDYTHLVLVTEAVIGPITSSIVLGSAHWQHTSNIFDARLGNATN